MSNFRIALPCALVAGLIAGCARPRPSEVQAPVVPATQPSVQASPKLEILNQQIKANTNNAQAYSNRGYVLALLGQKDAARADLRRAALLKDDGPMHNRLGWAYFNMGDYVDALREFETAAKL